VEVVLQSTASEPVIVATDCGMGRHVIFTTSLAASVDADTSDSQPQEWTTLPLMPSFVPLLHRATGYSYQVNADRSLFRVGKSLYGAFPDSASRSCSFVLNSEEPILIPRDSGQAHWELPAPTNVGFGQVRSDGATFSVAVNADLSESSLDRIDVSQLPDWIRTAEGGAKGETVGAGAVPSQRAPTGAGTVVFLSVLALLLVCEPVVAGATRRGILR
ncbi:MAG: hypothetical protein KDB27_36160, partial [Planctomycetales bacterium]|nr:hypothetical protein [Planctomycetales bacterium]